MVKYYNAKDSCFFYYHISPVLKTTTLVRVPLNLRPARGTLPPVRIAMPNCPNEVVSGQYIHSQAMKWHVIHSQLALHQFLQGCGCGVGCASGDAQQSTALSLRSCLS